MISHNKDGLSTSPVVQSCRSVEENNSRRICVFFINIQSMRNKFFELEAHLNKNNIDVLCVAEHWLCDDELDLYTPVHYKLGSAFCRINSAHGGVAIFIKDTSILNQHCESINVSEYCIEGQCEIVASAFPSEHLIIASVYRTPSANIELFTDNIDNFTSFLCNSQKYRHFRVVVAGDINIDVRNSCTKTLNFLNVLRSADFYCLNYEPTRLNSCLDNVFSNISQGEIECTVEEPHLSDHQGLRIYIQEKVERSAVTPPTKISYRKLNGTNLDLLRYKLSTINWFKILNNFNSADLATQMFLSILSGLLNQCCPVLQKKSYKRKVHIKNWFTPELDNLRSLMVAYHEISKVNSNYLQLYYNLKHEYRTQIKLAKKQANENYISKSSNKCKAAWMVINAETNRLKCTDTDLPISADDFNKHFANICDIVRPNDHNVNINSVLQLLNCKKIDPKMSFFKWKVVTVNNVKKVLSSLSGSHSEDFYGFSNFILKQLQETLLQPLTYLINWMFQEGVYPSCLKISVTVPIYKKGDKSCADNYRPISLVPVISKVVESIMQQQLVSHVESNNLFSESQFGFRSGKSTSKAVENLAYHVLQCFEMNDDILATLLDLSKGFDIVNHSILLEKIEYYGVKGLELNLLKSYLSNRLQMTKIKNEKSELLDIMNGVPQGSVLGPFLFLVYINDLPYYVNDAKCILYADDTTFLTNDRDPENLRQKSSIICNKAEYWFRVNKLIVNRNKTENMIFSLKNNREIKNVKFLGINIDTKLNWEAHTINLCKRLSRVTYLLSKLKSCTSIASVINSYYAFFHVHLLYGILLWGNSPGAKEVFLWQKKALRRIVGIPPTETCRNHFRELGILTVPSIYILHCLLHAKCNINSLTQRSNIHDHVTRNNNQLDVPQVRLSKTQKSFNYMSIKLFNKLPISARYVTLSKFKCIMQVWLKSKSIYSLQEWNDISLDNLNFT